MAGREDQVGDFVTVRSTVERKDPSLPRFIAIPSASVETWSLEATRTVLVEVNGIPIGRRSLKYWSDRDSWFFDLTARQCLDSRAEEGDAVEVRVALADESPPAEILEVLRESSAKQDYWNGLSPSRQREISEHVRSGMREETRRRRAHSALGIQASQ